MYDASFKHPLTAIVAGPSGVGKTTFVSDFIKNSHILMDKPFTYILIFIGTPLSQNKIFEQLQKDRSDVEVIEVFEVYKSRKEFESNFKTDFLKTIQARGPGGCIVFDDLMGALSQCGLLSDLFSTYAAHYDVSVMHITQNLFHKGKDPNEHITLYRNTHMLVLFRNPMDQNVARFVARRLGSGRSYQDLMRLFDDIHTKERYILIYGGFERPIELKFSTDIFRKKPFLHMRVFKLDKYEKDVEKEAL